MLDLSVPRLTGERALEALGPWMREREIRRALVITSPGARHFDDLRAALEGCELELDLFDEARVHVPGDVVAAARSRLASAKSDAIVSLGGGSATGLAKMLRLEGGRELPFVAIATTYAGSEMTRIWGTTTDGNKQTGRDDAVRPDLVVHDPRLFVSMPRHFTVASLANAMAHPISALSTGSLEGELREAALEAAGELYAAVLDLAWRPRHAGARARALDGMALAATFLDRASLGDHHAVAHAWGGAFDLPHAQLHALLLPQSWQSLREGDRATFDELSRRCGHADPTAQLFDALVQAGVPTALRRLGPSRSEALEHAARKLEREDAPGWVRDAFLGRRPSIKVRRLDVGMAEPASVIGPPFDQALAVVVAIHGRGATADDMVRRAREIGGDDPRITIVAPMAAEAVWYAHSYRAPLSEREDGGAGADQALADLGALLDRVGAQVGDPERIHLFGFSQGACVCLEHVARTGRRLGSLVAIGGARLGPSADWSEPHDGVADLSALLGLAEDDSWVSAEDVRTVAERWLARGADVELQIVPGEAHEITARQRIRARELWRDRDDTSGQSGFGNTHHGEQLPGAVPRSQNSPRHVPYGLYAEQISGSGFVARRGENLRTWVYKVRPSSGHRLLEPLDHATFNTDFADEPAAVNLAGYEPLLVPETPTDFVDGVHTFAGAGDPRTRRGAAIHLYVANRSMEHRAFCNADGDMLLVPELGAMTVQTELGVLDLAPGQIMLIPRGLLFAVHLHDDEARGFIGETYGKPFELPDRGPVGSNGMADERHFRAPTAWAEDRLDPGYRRTVKAGGVLYEVSQDHTPWDVFGWHGNYTPYVFDLSDFAAITTGRVDHMDPSAGTVLSAPLDEPGYNALDFVFFPERFDVSKHTFRPPFFHRNVITEFNGIVQESPRPDSPFGPGVCFLTPKMTPHGVMARSVEHALRQSDAEADEPIHLGHGSLWFQFETALPLSLSRWARTARNRRLDWDGVWGRYAAYFDRDAPHGNGGLR